jgi:hypothetical protein
MSRTFLASAAVRPDHLWDPPSLLSNGRGVKRTTHLLLVPRSRIVQPYIHSPVLLYGIVLDSLLNEKENFNFAWEILEFKNVQKAAPKLKRLVAGFSPRRSGFDPGAGQVAFVVDKVPMGQVFSEYFGFPCQSSFHQILHHLNHPGQVTIGQSVAAVPSGSSWTPPPTKRIKKRNIYRSSLPSDSQ